MTIFLSELRLSRDDYWKIRTENGDVFDAYTLHKIIYSLFPLEMNEDSNAAEDRGRFLYMDCDFTGKSREKRVLIVSSRAPNRPDIGKLCTEEIPDGFLDHDRYGFEIVVNPAVRDNKTGKIIPIRSSEHTRLLDWFQQKAPSCGFKVEEGSLAVGHTDVMKFKKAGHDVVIGRVQYTGRLTVIDRAAFIKSFVQGIGREKAFGCGLLRIVPLSPASSDA